MPKYQQIEKCKNTINQYRERYVYCTRDPGNENITIIVREHKTSTTNNYQHVPYYMSKIKQR